MPICSSHRTFLPVLLAVVLTVTMGLSVSSRICGDRHVGASPSATISAAVNGVYVSPRLPERPCETSSTREAENAAVEGAGAPALCCVWQPPVDPVGVIAATREAADLFEAPYGDSLEDDPARGADPESATANSRTINAPAPSSLLPARQYTSVFLL